MSGSPQLVQSQQQQQQQQQQIQQQQLQQQQLTRVPVSSNIIRTGKGLLPVPVSDQQYTCFNIVMHYKILNLFNNITYRDQG
jgi:transcription initiation factor TFIID subunit TAF12